MIIQVDRQPFDPGPAAWNNLLGDSTHYPTLEENECADFLVIGSGFAGLSAALRLIQLEPKAKISVMEARQVAEGPAGRNSGFMIDLPHNLNSKDYAGDRNTDRLQTTLNREAIEFARKASQQFEMPEEAFTVSGKINAAATQKGHAHNLDYAAHLSALGEENELLDERSMKAVSGSQYYTSGLFTPGTAMLQPALYMRSLAKGFHQLGGKIYENSPVVSLKRENRNWVARSVKGEISAGRIILAVNGHAESFGFFKQRLMHIYLYASMTRELSREEIKALGGEPRWAFTPADPMGTTVRKISDTGGHRILVRNGFTWSPERTVSSDKLKSVGAVHDRSFSNRFPQLKHVSMEYRWGGLLCLSRNTAPAFGEVDEGIFSACCQNGLGTAMGTLSGKLAAELAVDHASSSLDEFLGFPSPQKLPPEPLATIGANAYMRWGEFKAGKEL